MNLQQKWSLSLLGGLSPVGRGLGRLGCGLGVTEIIVAEGNEVIIKFVDQWDAGGDIKVITSFQSKKIPKRYLPP